MNKKSGRLLQNIFILAISGTVLLMVIAGLVFWHVSRSLPKIINVSDYHPAGVTRIVATGGKESVDIGEFFKERRYLIPYDKIPDHVVRAFISAEDDRFFEHPGINIVSILRAGIANFRAGHVVQGGSTITQQVAKSLLLTPERSFDRKIKEVILASRIEANLNKKQILYLYLNQIYLGHGAYGVQAATRAYFGKDISQITLAEAAILAGMPQAPGKYSPLLNPKRAKERQLYVLRRMLENKYISQSEFNESTVQPVKIYHDEDINGKYAPYYVEYLRKYLIEKYGEKSVYEEGLTVSVPVNPELLQVASKSVRNGLSAIDKRMGYRGANKHLKDSEEIEKFLEEERLELIEKKVRFQLLRSDGRLDSIEAMKFAGIQSEVELLEPGELYEAVVTGFEGSKKSARVMIGAVKAELPLENMKWARAAKDEKNPNAPKWTTVTPSAVFNRGDVILVSLAKESSSKEVVVNLEQIPQIQGALFSMDVHTGEVLSMVGGYDFEQSEFNRALQAQRQPGSAFKPIIYAAALEKGFTPASVIMDSPIVFKDANGTSTWKPNNYEEKFYGDTTFRQALIKSRNIPTVKLVQSIQVPYLIQYAKRIGMNSQFTPDLSISLGSSSLSLMDMTKVYSLFPRLGRKVTPQFFSKIVDRDGNVLQESTPQSISSIRPVSLEVAAATPEVIPSATPSPGATGTTADLNNAPKVVFPNYPLPEDPDQVQDPRVAYVMTHLMKEVVKFGTGHEASNLGRPAAGKTGTTNDSMDGWFLGFTPDVVTGVWVGFDSQKSIGQGETGAKTALPIWLNYMKEAVKAYPDGDFKVPPGVVFANIDSNTGKLAAPSSTSAIKEAFIEGTQPTESSESGSTSTETQSDFFKEDRE
jgi:penicillin-binding protein 1A